MESGTLLSSAVDTFVDMKEVDMVWLPEGVGWAWW
eukprot:CAMPEP_0114054198 /NCGR_PEP_ID=MMETSP1339-20121228/84753_1 /TAXON_ID=94617 /ORGANISM="Fibrocapsa japonica" /LENGTH=34 /assembly_acc=CAM_ASM_000762